MSRHRGAKPCRRCGLLGKISLLSRSTFYPLSDGPSTRGRRITRADFRPCSACGPRSQARLCSCALRTVADRPERTLRAPPLLFGRRPPHQTARLARSPGRPGLGRRRDGAVFKGQLPPGLAPGLRSLLPILYAPRLRLMPSCSKGSRGLSVLPRESASSRIMQFRRAHGRDSAQVVAPFVQVGTYPTRNFATLGPL